MAELKTQQTDASVSDFINHITDATKRADSLTIIELLTKITGAPPKMWGSAIIGFGMRHLTYTSGRELEWMVLGFSPRKATLTFYINNGFPRQEALLANLGTYKTSGGCLYIKRLSDINLSVLAEFLTESATIDHPTAL